jgi:hypothetical protein
VFGPFGRPAHVAGSPAPAVGAAHQMLLIGKMLPIGKMLLISPAPAVGAAPHDKPLEGLMIRDIEYLSCIDKKVGDFGSCLLCPLTQILILWSQILYFPSSIPVIPIVTPYRITKSSVVFLLFPIVPIVAADRISISISSIGFDNTPHGAGSSGVAPSTLLWIQNGYPNIQRLHWQMITF